MVGHGIGARRIFIKTSAELFCVPVTANGVCPTSNSYIKIPNAYQSTPNEWPLVVRIISGARYSGVPQSVNVLESN